MDTVVLGLFCIALFSNIIEAISGFGSTVIAVTLGAHFLSVDKLVPALVPVNVLMNLYLVLAHRHKIEKKLLTQTILPIMSAGVFMGLAFFNTLASSSLKQMLGLFVVVFCARQLVLLLNKTKPKPMHPWLTTALIGASGIIHGLYASGGPLLVYALSGRELDKTVLRSTLSTVWLILNLFLLISYGVTGKINLGTLQYSLIFLPTLPVGIALGEFLHQYIPEEKFRIAVFSLLVFAGLSLVF